MENKDYTKLTLDELLAEEKKIKKMEITSAVFVGFLIGVIIYGVATKGFHFLYIFIPLLLIAGVAKNSQNLKQKLNQVQAEIKAKGTT